MLRMSFINSTVQVTWLSRHREQGLPVTWAWLLFLCLILYFPPKSCFWSWFPAGKWLTQTCELKIISCELQIISSDLLVPAEKGGDPLLSPFESSEVKANPSNMVYRDKTLWEENACQWEKNKGGLLPWGFPTSCSIRPGFLISSLW